jgi:hypothetical protein
MSDLVVLARRYVALSDQLEAVRGEIAKAVLNGGGGEPVRPTRPARAPGGGQSNHPNAQAAAQEETKIIALLKDQPGLRTTQIAKATESKVNTTTQRLARMRDKGAIIRQEGHDAGWQAAAAPA